MIWKTFNKEETDTRAHSRQALPAASEAAGDRPGHSHLIPFNNNQKQSERDPKQSLGEGSLHL